MSPFVQVVLVSAIVAFASLYAALKVMPAGWRRRVASLAARTATRWGFSESNARRVEAKLSTGGACGSCDTCKACATDLPVADPAMPFRTIPIKRATTSAR